MVDRGAPLEFAVATHDGRPARLQPHMGMAGHAMITRHDGAVFVHLHPAGTISPVAAQETFLFREPGDTIRGRLAQRLTAAEMGRGEGEEAAPAVVSFPNAFPMPGRYRIWVQVKRGGRVQTGVLDAAVWPAR